MPEKVRKFSELSVKMVRYGCTNRPFFHVIVNKTKKARKDHPIEQLGVYDPMPNSHREAFVSLDFARLYHYIKNGTTLTDPVVKLLGVCGYYPVKPSIYVKAKRRREAKAKREQEASEKENDTDNEGTAV